jgi:hypothetical protein
MSLEELKVMNAQLSTVGIGIRKTTPWLIWGFHGGDYEEWCLLGCYAEWFIHEPHGVTTQKTPFFNSVAFSPQAFYTDWSIATGQRILVLTFATRGVSCGQRGGKEKE